MKVRCNPGDDYQKMQVDEAHASSEACYRIGGPVLQRQRRSLALSPRVNHFDVAFQNASEPRILVGTRRASVSSLALLPHAQLLDDNLGLARQFPAGSALLVKMGAGIGPPGFPRLVVNESTEPPHEPPPKAHQ